MAWSDAARAAAAEARRRHGKALGRVNRLTPGALRSDNMREMDTKDLQNRYPGLSPAQARLLRARLRMGRGSSFASRSQVRNYMSEAKGAEDSAAQGSAKMRAKDFKAYTGKRLTMAQANKMQGVLTRYFKR